MSDGATRERCPICGSRNAFASPRYPTSADLVSGVCLDCRNGWIGERGYADRWEEMNLEFPAIGLVVFSHYAGSQPEKAWPKQG